MGYLQGTRRYQSCAVLRSYHSKPKDPITPHDYMDDLESFFYMLCELMFTRVSFNKEVDPVVKVILQRWDAKDERTAIDSKATFLSHPVSEDLIDAEYWGVACTELVEGFHAMLQTITQEKAKIMSKSSVSVQERITRLRGMGLNGGIDSHYDTLETLFNKTLKALETEEPEIDARIKRAKLKAGYKDEENASAPQRPVNVQSAYATRSSAKRASENVEGLEVAERPTKSIRLDRDIPTVLSFENDALDSV